MADLVKTDSDTKYNQSVVGSKSDKETSSQVQERSLTNERSGTQNGTGKTTGTVTGSEKGTQTGNVKSAGSDKTVGVTNSERKTESVRSLSGKSTSTQTDGTKVNIGLSITFRVPIKGKFPAFENPNPSC